LRASPWNTIPHRTCTFSGGKYLWEHPSFVLRCKGAAKNKAPQKVVTSCYNLVSTYYRTVRKKRLFIVLYLKKK